MENDLHAHNKKGLHYFEAMVPQMEELCKPLSYLGITHFWYDKFFSSGEYLCLGNDLIWKRHFYTQDLFNFPNSLINNLKTTPLQQEQSFVWKGYSSQDCALLAEQRKFNIDHNLSIISKQVDYAETFTFASTIENSQIINFYMKNLNVIKAFCLFFKKRASSLIETCQKKDMAFLSETNLFSPYNDPPIWNEKVVEFFQKVNEKPSWNASYYSFMHCSKREKECLMLLSTGKTAKEIARSLDLRPSTIEYYIANIKKKTGYHRATDLVRFFLESQQ